jgi:hypothetical protein
MSMIDAMVVMSRRFKQLRDTLEEIRQFQNEMSQNPPEQYRWAIAQCFRLSQVLRDVFSDNIPMVGCDGDDAEVVQQCYVVLCTNPDDDGLVVRMSDVAVFGPFDTYSSAKIVADEAEGEYGEVEVREVHTDSGNGPL